MRNIFINVLNKKEIARKKARGYNKLVINAETGEDIKFRTEEKSLYIESTEQDLEDKEFCYVILCNEFGLAGLDKGFKTKLNVMFLDNGYMLVTVKVGEILVTDDTIKMYSTVETVPQIIESKNGKTNILWVNANYLMSYIKNEDITGTKRNFMYDIEFCLEVGGNVINKDIFESEEQFELHSLSEEDIDMSLGQYAKYLSELNVEEQEESDEDSYEEEGEEDIDDIL